MSTLSYPQIDRNVLFIDRNTYTDFMTSRFTPEKLAEDISKIINRNWNYDDCYISAYTVNCIYYLNLLMRQFFDLPPLPESKKVVIDNSIKSIINEFLLDTENTVSEKYYDVYDVNGKDCLVVLNPNALGIFSKDKEVLIEFLLTVLRTKYLKGQPYSYEVDPFLSMFIGLYLDDTFFSTLKLRLP